jgi:hypothetical protein
VACAAEPFDATMTRHPAQHKGMMSEHREHGTHGKERARRRVSEGSIGRFGHEINKDD